MPAIFRATDTTPWDTIRPCLRWYPESRRAAARAVGISIRRDRYLRILMMHGARAELGKDGGKRDLRSLQIGREGQRRHPHAVSMPLANKIARIFWSILTPVEAYRQAQTAVGNRINTSLSMNHASTLLVWRKSTDFHPLTRLRTGEYLVNHSNFPLTGRQLST